jgi:hypothetical protein
LSVTRYRFHCPSSSYSLWITIVLADLQNQYPHQQNLHDLFCWELHRVHRAIDNYRKIWCL